MRIPNVGDSVSEQIAKYMSKVPYTFFNLNKEAVGYFVNESNEINRQSIHIKNFNTLMIALQNVSIRVIFEKDESKVVNFEMTGEPPTIAYLEKHFTILKRALVSELKHKDDYVTVLAKLGFKHTSISKATVLLTDSYTSTTGKMKKATDDKIKIISYEDVLIKLKVIEKISNKSTLI